MDPALVRELFDYREGWLYNRENRGTTSRAGQQVGTPAGKGYLVVGIQRRNYLLHRLVWAWHHGVWPAHEIDHINGIRGDNRIENLRDVDRQMNNENRRAAGRNARSTGLLGACRFTYKGRVYVKAYITTGGRMLNLGYYPTPAEAHQAYLIAKRQLHAGNTL
jgi:hypothetical protein